MDRISVMRAFCRIVELGSFSKAAEDLGVSSALLSRETKQLEASLGCLLLSRTTRSMSLTDHGATYYDESRRLLAELDNLDDTVRERVGALKGTLRINAPLSFALTVLSRVLPGFMAQYPDVKMSISMDDHILDMVEGGFDLSIRIRADLPDSNLVAQPIGTVRQQLFAAPSYLDRHGRPSAPDDLKDHSLLSFSLADSGSHWPLHLDGTVVDVPLRPRLTAGNSLFLHDQLVAGLGIGSLPSFIFEPSVQAGTLERVLPDYALADRTIFAVIPNRLGADVKTKAFADYLKDQFAG